MYEAPFAADDLTLSKDEFILEAQTTVILGFNWTSKPFRQLRLEVPSSINACLQFGKLTSHRK